MMARVIACKWAPGMCDRAQSPSRATRTYLLRIGGRVREIAETGGRSEVMDDEPMIAPWELALDACDCELYLRECDPTNGWCNRHEEWRELCERWDAAGTSPDDPESTSDAQRAPAVSVHDTAAHRATDDERGTT